MVNPNIFREYDIRGNAEKDFTPDIVYSLGRAFGTYFTERGVREVTLGRDCRLSSPRLHQHLSRGLRDCGCNVIDLAIIPTPLLYFSLFNLDVDGGVMVTGSHNPPDENGFKICVGKTTIFGEEIQQIRRIMGKGVFSEGIGEMDFVHIKPPYVDTVQSLLVMGDRRPKVVIDSGNGTAGPVAGGLYRKLGAEVIELFSNPDGNFPNHHPDPTVPANLETLIQTVKEERADVGIAFDGDADRIGVIDENGSIVWGDQLMIIFSRAILHQIPGATIIAEVKCSQTLFDDIEQRGGRAIMWKVGHSPIKAKLKEENAALAGEMSGHIFFANRYFGYDDALYAGARLIEILSHTESKLSGLLAGVPPTVTTPEIRVPCSDELKFMIVEKLVEHFRRDYQVIDVDGARVLFDSGWGLVRASNTQPVLVLRFEARDKSSLEHIQELVQEQVRAAIAEASQ